LTILGALGLEGVVAAMTIAAGTTTAVFRAYLRDVLLPVLKQRKPNAILVMDNLSAHKGDEIRQLIEEAGFTAKFLPRYSPDFSPIEPCWSKMKTILREKEARSVEALDREMPSGSLAAVMAILPCQRHIVMWRLLDMSSRQGGSHVPSSA
jgi:transposase